MKEGFDREMDTLLRRRARGTAESRSWGDGAGAVSHGAHLDADELGAFAEGALPAAARLAAASHLADCDRCRGVVVGLSRVAGAEREVKQHAFAVPASAETARTFSWRALFASLFTPTVMRLAVPVLALSLVGAVSYVALRSKSNASLQEARTASPRNNGALQVEPQAPAAANVNAEATKLESVATLNSNAAPREAPAPGAQTRGHGEAGAPAAETGTSAADTQPATDAPPPPAPAAVATEGPPALSKAAPKQAEAEEGEAAKGDYRDRADNKDKAARTSEPSDDYIANEAAAQRSRAAQSRMNQVQMPDGGSRNEKRSADNNVSNNSTGGLAGGGTSTAPKESDRERAATRSETFGRSRAARSPEKKRAGEDEDARSGDTRAAAGHRFRREGGAWVDVNYRPSMPSTGVHRGTDSYRALVADVPEVGRVAEAIGGEVIVVVGGRAYRIR